MEQIDWLDIYKTLLMFKKCKYGSPEYNALYIKICEASKYAVKALKTIKWEHSGFKARQKFYLNQNNDYPKFKEEAYQKENLIIFLACLRPSRRKIIQDYQISYYLQTHSQVIDDAHLPFVDYWRRLKHPDLIKRYQKKFIYFHDCFLKKGYLSFGLIHYYDCSKLYRLFKHQPEQIDWMLNFFTVQTDRKNFKRLKECGINLEKMKIMPDLSWSYPSWCFYVSPINGVVLHNFDTTLLEEMNLILCQQFEKQKICHNDYYLYKKTQRRIKNKKLLLDKDISFYFDPINFPYTPTNVKKMNKMVEELNHNVNLIFNLNTFDNQIFEEHNVLWLREMVKLGIKIDFINPSGEMYHKRQTAMLLSFIHTNMDDEDENNKIWEKILSASDEAAILMDVGF